MSADVRVMEGTEPIYVHEPLLDQAATPIVDYRTFCYYSLRETLEMRAGKSCFYNRILCKAEPTRILFQTFKRRLLYKGKLVAI